MNRYNIVFVNDMGHLMIQDFNDIPENVKNFAYEVVKNKIVSAKDNSHLGCIFYILIDGLLPTWTYKYKDVEITIDYSKLDKYDSRRMIYI